MDDVSSHVGVRHFYALMAKRVNLKDLKGLVVGFGEGHEANYLKKVFDSHIFGIDVETKGTLFDFNVAFASALELPFPNESFDFVFFHHVIEHVPNPEKSLADISRVLRPGGLMYLGTPNRHRVVGYLGSYGASISEKIAWNLADYKDRLRGRFENELGAHAGFSNRELEALFEQKFSEVTWLTKEYLEFKYGSRLPAPVLGVLTASPVMKYASPAIYAICKK